MFDISKENKEKIKHMGLTITSIEPAKFYGLAYTPDNTAKKVISGIGRVWRNAGEISNISGVNIDQTKRYLNTLRESGYCDEQMIHLSKNRTNAGTFFDFKLPENV
jgi:hypothetical protein